MLNSVPPCGLVIGQHVEFLATEDNCEVISPPEVAIPSRFDLIRQTVDLRISCVHIIQVPSSSSASSQGQAFLRYSGPEDPEVINQAWLFQTLGDYYSLPFVCQCKTNKDGILLTYPVRRREDQSTKSVRENTLEGRPCKQRDCEIQGLNIERRRQA